LKRKGANSYGLKLLKDSLMIPVRDMAGTLHGIQFISPDGSKKFKTGTNKTGHFHTIGKAKDNTIVIAEGYATAASIHQATGHCVRSPGRREPLAVAEVFGQATSSRSSWQPITASGRTITQVTPKPYKRRRRKGVAANSWT
jgi:hypothetical protein